ncbi:MAG TPA: hypothetical protein VF316_21010 [Polyangiaceae bacterium]
MKSLTSCLAVIAVLGSAACATSVVNLDDDGGVPLLDAGKDVGVQDTGVIDTGTQDDGSAPPPDSGVDAPNPDAGAGVAILQVNEVNPNITGSLDLIELRVTSGGSTLGITVEQDITTKVVLATLPAITVATGDFIVVHDNPAVAITNETTTKATCVAAACYAGAWDVRGGATALTYSGRLVVVRAPNSTIMDGVAFYKKGSTSPAAFHTEVTALQTANEWLPADCGGVACSTNALAEAISADWAACAVTAGGVSVARKGNADTNKAADWVVGPSSFGATNP